VLGAVLVRHVLAARQVLLHRGVHDDLLGDGVAGQLPDELVLVAGLGVVVAVGVDDLVVVLLKLAMVVLDEVRDGDPLRGHRSYGRAMA